MKAKSLLVASLFAMSFALVACGGEETTVPTDSTATMDTAPVTAPAPAATVSDSTAPAMPADTAAVPADTPAVQ